MRMSLI